MAATRSFSPILALPALFSVACGAIGDPVEVGGTLVGEPLPPPPADSAGGGANGGGGTPGGGSQPGAQQPPPALIEPDPADDLVPPVAPPAPTTCGGQAYPADPKTLEMYVLFDDSGSWPDAAWTAAMGAVRGFITDAASDGVGMALSFFGPTCDANLFLTPQVPMATLPANRAELQAALDLRKPDDGQTVTEPALAGGLQYATARLASGANARLVMLLVTDGEPDVSDCKGTGMANDIPAVAAVAAAGFGGATPVSTYVLAVGGLQFAQQLQSIAVAGGTGTVINGDAASLFAAFEKIRNEELASLPCEYDLPPEYAKINDPDLVNLTFADAPLGRVPALADCNPATGGWYYDDPAAPKRVIACAATCGTFKKAAQGTSVNISLGCPTIKQKISK